MLGVHERARVLPFVAFIGLLAAEPLLKTGLSAIGLSTHLAYGLRILLALAMLWHYRLHYTELKYSVLEQRSQWSPLVWALLGGLLVFVCWILPYPAWLGSKPEGGVVIVDLFWLTCRWAGSALVVPVMEELFWRSYVMRKLDATDFMAVSPATVSACAVLVSSVLFAVEHQLWCAGLLAGLVYAGLYRRFQLLWLSVLAHMITNAALGLWVVTGGHWQYW